MVQTRSASSSPVKKRVAETSNTTTVTGKSDLPPPGPALRLLIAPQDLPESARLIPQINPATNTAQSFLFCPSNGLFELKKLSRPNHELKSVLFASSGAQDGISDASEPPVSSGYINRHAECTTATPYDMCFLLLPIAIQCANSNMFQSVEDMLDTANANEHMRYVCSNSRLIVETSMGKICDCVEVGDERMYRYNKQKTLESLIAKARKACEHGLPPSLEDKYVSRMLEVPVLSIRREESSISLADSEKENIAVPSLATPDSFESKSSVISAEPSVVFSEVSITSTTVTTADEKISPAIRDLQRLRIAFKFIIHSYCSPTFARSMEELLSSSSSNIDFTSLNSHLSYLQQLRADVAASHSLSIFTQKRKNFEDEEDDEIRAEKKRKIDEEERKKKFLQSRGVRELGKVDVKGMKKMSDFFTKKPVVATKAKR